MGDVIVSMVTAEGRPEVLDQPIETNWKTGELARLVAADKASWQEHPTLLQNRKLHRRAFRHSVVVTPLESMNMQPIGESVVARGRDISSGGIAFDHDAPIANRHVAVTLQAEDGGSITMVTSLNWCRFTREGSYYSGGRFIRQIDRPECDFDWDSVMCDSHD